MTTESGEIRIGYHIRIRYHPWCVVVVHAPTENWQHRPGDAKPKYGYWVGPLASGERAAQVAEDLADELGYTLELCKICFRDRKPPVPTEGEAPAGLSRSRKRRLAYEPTRADTQRKSRRGA